MWDKNNDLRNYQQKSQKSHIGASDFLPTYQRKKTPNGRNMQALSPSAPARQIVQTFARTYHQGPNR